MSKPPTIPSEAEDSRLGAFLLEAVHSQRDWREIGRSIAGQLRSPDLDWRDLVRGVDQARAMLPQQPAGADNPLGRLDRAIIWALQVAAIEIDRDELQRGAAEMLEACTADTAPQKMLHSVLAVLRRYVPFDCATYAVYHHGTGAPNDPPLVRSLLSVDGEEEFRWPVRWMEMSPSLLAWVESGQRWIDDAARFRDEHPEHNDARSNGVAREYEKRGINSFLITRRREGGRVVASLTLGRRRNAPHPPFVHADQDRLDLMRMKPVLQRIGGAFDAHTAAVGRQVAALFRARAEPLALARELVRQLGEGFGWEYVAVFRVNRARGRFEMVAQHDANTEGQLSIAPDYDQSLDKGMLSEMLRQRRPLYAPEVRSQPSPYGYITLGDKQKSATCFPVRLGEGEDAPIEWALFLESSQEAAFPEPEQQVLGQVIHEIERSLQLWFESRLNAALLEMSDQGVVVLGGGNRIERANGAALRLLGLPVTTSFPLPEEISSLDRFVVGHGIGDLPLMEQGRHERARLRLRGADGVERSVLASASYNVQALHRRVWLLTDLDQQEWVGSLSYMEAAVRAISTLTRGRLLLTGTLLWRAAAEPDLAPRTWRLLDQATRCLASADITFERIASFHDALAEPLREHGPVDLADDLRRFREFLPDDDAAALDLVLDTAPVTVWGDAERLGFALRSLLGHLLTVRQSEATLRVALARNGTSADLVVTMPGTRGSGAADTLASLNQPDSASRPRDALRDAEQRAYAVVSHGLVAVRRIFEAHGATIEFERLPGAEARLRIGLPLGITPKAAASDGAGGTY